MTLSLEREIDSNLFIVETLIDDKHELRMILDTGASNTTIDSNALYLLGYELKDSTGNVEIETANGIIVTETFDVEIFYALGITKNKFSIQVYDFLAHGIYSDYSGLLGIDFLENTKFCINTQTNKINISKLKRI